MTLVESRIGIVAYARVLCCDLVSDAAEQKEAATTVGRGDRPGTGRPEPVDDEIPRESVHAVRSSRATGSVSRSSLSESCLVSWRRSASIPTCKRSQPATTSQMNAT